MVFQSVASRKFSAAQDLLLGDRAMQVCRACTYKTTGATRRRMLSLIEAMLDGLSSAGLPVPERLGGTVLRLYEQAFEEAAADTFGNASVQALAGLMLRLVDAGCTALLQPPGEAAGPEPAPEAAAVDLPELRRAAIGKGMTFREAKAAGAQELTQFIENVPEAPRKLSWRDAASWTDGGDRTDGREEWDINGVTARVSDMSTYCIVGADRPFPQSGTNSATVVFTDCVDMMSVGLCASFDDAKGYEGDCYAWFANGPLGWSLHNDGDSGNGGSWLGGEYSAHRFSNDMPVTVIFNADEGTISFEVNGTVKQNVYTGLPKEVYLVAAIEREGTVEILESFLAAAAPGAGAGAAALETLAMLGATVRAGEGRLSALSVFL